MPIYLNKSTIQYNLIQLQTQMLKQYDTVSIGFGNKVGQTTQVFLKEKVNIISIGEINSKNRQTKIEIIAKNYAPLHPGILGDMIRKRRDRGTLLELIKTNVSINFEEIEKQCDSIESKIENDLAIVGAMMQETNTEKFIKETGASAGQAQKYLNKYSNLAQAVKTYKIHNEKVKKFMQQNQCNKENAVSFLESCDYNDEFLN